MEEDTSGNNHLGMPRIIEDSGRRFCSIQPANLVVVGLCAGHLVDYVGRMAAFIAIKARFQIDRRLLRYFEFLTLILVLLAGLIHGFSTYPLF